MDDRLESIVEILEAWAGGQLIPPIPYEGICYNLRLQFPAYPSDIMGLVPSAVQSWPEFSGNMHYPVPHPGLPPETAYTEKRKVEKWSGEYGESRRRLCQHCADWIRENPEKALSLVRED